MSVAVASDQILEEGKFQPAVAEFVAVIVAATAFGAVAADAAVAVAADAAVAVALYIVAESIVTASAVSIFAADCVAFSSLIFVVVNDAFFGSLSSSLKPSTTIMAHLQLQQLPRLGSD